MRESTRHGLPLLIEPLEERMMMDWGMSARIIGQSLTAAKYKLTGAGQTIAIIDTGVDYTHPALGGNMGSGYKVLGGYDFVDNDSDPKDVNGHGTGVAGIAAANRWLYEDEFKYEGVAPGANIVALRVISEQEESWNVEAQRIINALQWIIDNRATYNIVAANLSIGYGHFNTEGVPNDSFATINQALSDALADVVDAGVFIAASSGNGGYDANDPGIEYPASDPSVFAVGASTRINGTDSVWSSSARGTYLDLLAPGENVGAPYLDSLTGAHIYLQPEVDGTSFAVPHVVGAAALLKELDPTMTPGQIGGALKFLHHEILDPVDQVWREALSLPAVLSFLSAPTYAVGEGGTYNDIIYDSAGKLHMSWYNQAEGTLYYANRSSTGIWSDTEVVDDRYLTQGEYVSIAVDAQDRPAVAYYDPTYGDLVFSRFNGSAWVPADVDAGGAGDTGRYPSLAFNNLNRPVIAYYDQTNGDLEWARQAGDGSWTLETIDSSGNVGQYPSLTLRPAGGWALAYADVTNGNLKYATRPSSSWNIWTIDDVTGVSHISLVFDNNNNPGISYYNTGTTGLRYSKFDGTNWSAVNIAVTGIQGEYTSLHFDSNNKANIVYYDQTNNSVVKAVNTSGSTWSLTTLQSNGGPYVRAAWSSSGQLAYSYRRNSLNKVLVG